MKALTGAAMAMMVAGLVGCNSTENNSTSAQQWWCSYCKKGLTWDGLVALKLLYNRDIQQIGIEKRSKEKLKLYQLGLIISMVFTLVGFVLVNNSKVKNQTKT